MKDNEIINKLSAAADQITGGSVSHVRILADDFFAIYNLINRQKAEIERYKGVIKLLENDVLTTKTEAVKEFAERLKATFPSREDKRCTLDDCYTLDCIDNLVKEMAEQSTGYGLSKTE